MSSTDKPMFSFRDVITILTLASAFFIQHFTLKSEIHDAIVEQSFNKREMSEKIAAVEFRILGLDNKYDFLLRSQLPSPADRPKNIKIETETETQ
jgi:hypothetical protein